MRIVAVGTNELIARAFSNADKGRSPNDAFEYVAKYFENSLNELGARNPSIQVNFKRIDANKNIAVGC